MKNIGDSFLKISFTIGKVFSIILLIITMLIILFSGGLLLISTKVKIEAPSFETLKNEIKILQKNDSKTEYNQNTINNKNINSKYVNKIDSIVKNNGLSPQINENILEYLGNIPDDYKNDYLNGLDKFYKQGLKELWDSLDLLDVFLQIHIKREYNLYRYTSNFDYNKEYRQAYATPVVNGEWNKYICRGLLYEYNYRFEKLLSNANTKTQENLVRKIALGIILGISLLLFTILLFLPVLIKIEENTRYLLKNKNDQSEKTN